jgi:general secretion pathway protein D
VTVRPERSPSLRRLNSLNPLFYLLFCLLLMVPATAHEVVVTAPVPADIAARLADRARVARKADHTLRAYLLYSEAAKLDPTNTSYQQNRDTLAPFAKLLADQKLETADIQGDIAESRQEATPGSNASVARRLAVRAEKARQEGDTLKAYLLYEAAATRYPANHDYAENRNVLAPVASLLRSTNLDKTDISADIKAAELESLAGADPSIRPAGAGWQEEGSLASLPHVTARPERHDFDLRGNSETLIQQVTSVYGVHAIADPGMPKTGNYTLQITDADFHAALEALTLVTNTFVFPVSPTVVFFAEDTQAKRDELEPNVLLTVSLPNAMSEKDLIDVANGVRSVLNLRTFGWDSQNHTVLIRDRFTKAHVAKELLESLLVPHAQIALELQFLTLDSDIAYQYGVLPPSSFQVVAPLQKLFNLHTILPTLVNGTEYFALGGGLSTFGIGITSASAFATYSKSIATTSYDTTIVVQDGETASLHVGEKYPIPSSLYAGASQSAPSIYNPIGTFTEEDLGLELKVTPHLMHGGVVGMDVEADYKALGSLTLDTVPSVAEREFKGSVTLKHDQYAFLAGLDQQSKTRGKQGLAGLTSIPLLSALLSDNNTDKKSNQTLIVVKPVVRSLPVGDAINPQFLVGPVKGVRVLL